MGWILAAVFVLVSFGNAGIVLRWRTHGKSGSLLPLIGGAAGLGAFLMLPYPLLNHWWWTPLVVDLGTGYLAIATVVFLVRRLLIKNAV